MFLRLLLCVLLLKIFSISLSYNLQPKSFQANLQNKLKTSSKLATVLLLPFLPSVLPSLAATPIKDIKVTYDGVPKSLKEVSDGNKAILIVNVASQCALTPQYEELVELREKYKKQGFEVLAFPCNQFASQEPAPVARIRKDMDDQFGVKFPIFDKIDVNGNNQHPLYAALKEYKGEIVGSPNIGKISWNFEKFLLDSNLEPVRRYKPGIRPDALEADIKGLLTSGTIPPRKKPSLNDY